MTEVESEVMVAMTRELERCAGHMTRLNGELSEANRKLALTLDELRLVTTERDLALKREEWLLAMRREPNKLVLWAKQVRSTHAEYKRALRVFDASMHEFTQSLDDEPDIEEESK